MFGVIWPFTRYRDLTTQSSHFLGILVILDFFFPGYFSRFRVLRLFWSIKSFQRVFFVWIFCGFGGVLVILGV